MFKNIPSKEDDLGSFVENNIEKELGKIRFNAQVAPSFSRENKIQLAMKRRTIANSMDKIVGVLLLVIKFAKILKMAVERYFQTPTKSTLLFISDLSTFPSNGRNDFEFPLGLSSKLRNLIRDLPVLNHSSKIRNCFQRMDHFIKISLFILIPLILAFGVEFPDFFNSILKVLISLICGFYFLEAIVKMNSCCFFNGKLLLTKDEILIHYLQKEFQLDLSSILPLLISVIIFSQNYHTILTKLLNCAFFLKSQNVRHYFFSREILKSKQSKMDILLNFLLFCHISACLWYFCSDLSQHVYPSQSWILENGLPSLRFFEKYLNCYLYILETVSYQNHSLLGPQNPLEQLLLVFFIILSNCYLYSTIMELFSKSHGGLALSDGTIKESLDEQLTLSKAHSDLKLAVQRTLELRDRFTKRKSQELHCNHFITNLPEDVKNEYLRVTLDPVLRKIRLFRMFSQKTQQKLRTMAQKTSYFQGDRIYNRNSSTSSLFFVASGKVGFLLSENKQNLSNFQKTRKKNSVFNCISFFTGEPTLYSAICLEDCTLFRFERADFLTLLREHPPDYEKFCEVVEKLKISRDFKSIGLYCECCRSKSHLETECPSLHYVSTRHRGIGNIEIKSPIGPRKVERSFHFLRKNVKKKTITIGGPRLTAATYHSDCDDDSLLFDCVSSDCFKLNENRSLLDIDVILPGKHNFFPHNHSDMVVSDYNEKMVKKLEFVFREGMFEE